MTRDVFVQELMGDIYIAGMVVAAEAFMMLLSIVIDFVVGLIKSSRAGVEISSDRARATYYKIVWAYFALILSAMMDVLIIVYTDAFLPWLSMVVSFIYIGMELFSMFESVDRKQRAKATRALQFADALFASAKGRDLERLISELQKYNERQDKQKSVRKTWQPRTSNTE